MVAVMPWLAACASVAPGLHFNNAGSGTSAGSSASASASGGADAEAINAVLKPITPQLVKAERELREKQVSQDISKLLGRPGPYTIETGDVLSIVVWDHPELSNSATVAAGGNVGTGADASTSATTAPPAGFMVDHEGMVQFPFAGPLKVAGLTQDQARNLLTSKLSKYLKQPKVTLRVQSFRSKRVYIDGEVKNPGLQAINDIPMTLVEAINRAGGVLPTGDQSQIIINRNGTNYFINLPQLVQRGINPGSIMLANGDVVRVRSRDESKVFVSGEVVSPRALPMHNGRLTLNEALGESGGVNPTSGDGSQIYVIRKNGTEQVVYQLDGRAPGALAMAEGFELSPKDVVYVAATPLANWHRAISLILPGALSSAVGAVTPAR
ncbi:MAG TPA: polysaccharide biosynthesis/export family protein [Noviherbaspirillum sp.]|uniref:polysaccharide biosynthesis/export family protein n=1 Tax=Noviherbaspirillum sp. TaxID=1926288 RepID=UPI002D2B930A|nr:polysaccharide biosynthesis/export family protein [Noviherbaspirillum sp.]HYD95975.1 polysaccharide biosynthesis/export family protein [Noviherbaspirillum sp.]